MHPRATLDELGQTSPWPNSNPGLSTQPGSWMNDVGYSITT